MVEEARRPLTTRDHQLAKKIAQWLSKRSITPNQISLASILFAGLSGLSLLLFDQQQSSNWLLPILAAVFIQCRLLCNLFDGMVAVEGGKGTRSGELFNDIPDRIADALILIAAGYAITVVGWGDLIGWTAALLAVLTAYVRTLAVSIGAPVNFQGPMAKQHRMAVLTIACLVTAAESFLWQSGYGLMIGLIVIIVGCIITLIRRIRSAYQYLENETD